MATLQLAYRTATSCQLCRTQLIRAFIAPAGSVATTRRFHTYHEKQSPLRRRSNSRSTPSLRASREAKIERENAELNEAAQDEEGLKQLLQASGLAGPGILPFRSRGTSKHHDDALNDIKREVSVPGKVSQPHTRHHDHVVPRNEAQQVADDTATLVTHEGVPEEQYSRQSLAKQLPEEEKTTIDVEVSNAISTVEIPQHDDPNTPWYLQADATPAVPEKTLAERQALPDLPADSPPILQPLIEHLSRDIGLESLCILDLRGLDPPPALGSQLMMVVGTARGDRHVHIAADRHCRWLRQNYKLRPFADGLLGRNELKIKLRRKARRARLFREIGATEREGRDDGITTGWICVNIGQVPAAVSENGEAISQQRQAPIEGYLGFSSETEGVSLVVQMMTDSKRSELDLEKLWLDHLARTARKEKRAAEAVAAARAGTTAAATVGQEQGGRGGREQGEEEGEGEKEREVVQVGITDDAKVAVEGGVVPPTARVIAAGSIVDHNHGAATPHPPSSTHPHPATTTTTTSTAASATAAASVGASTIV